MAQSSTAVTGANAAAPEPICVRIPAAITMSGFSRSRIYELIATGELTVVKDRSSTLIVVESLREAVRRRIVQPRLNLPSDIDAG